MNKESPKNEASSLDGDRQRKSGVCDVKGFLMAGVSGGESGGVAGGGRVGVAISGRKANDNSYPAHYRDLNVWTPTTF